MQALTIWQPWAWAIGAGIKLVENRNWTPRKDQLRRGEDLVIHASVKPPSREDFLAMRGAAREAGVSEVPSLSDNVFSQAYGLGRVVAVVTFEGVASSVDDLSPSSRPWWVELHGRPEGRFGWLFSNVRQLQLGSAPSVRGQQGLWTLPGDAERIISAQLVQPEGQLWRRTAR